MEAAQLLEARRAFAAQDADGLLGGKAIMPRRHRRVGGKHALVAHHGQVGIGGRAQRTAAELAFEQSQREQRGVALVHVVDVDLHAQGAGDADAAHAKHDLLLEAVVGVAAIEVIGEAAIPAGVTVQVGIQKVDGDHMARTALHVVAPGAYGHDPVFHRDGDARRLFRAEIRGVP